MDARCEQCEYAVTFNENNVTLQNVGDLAGRIIAEFALHSLENQGHDKFICGQMLFKSKPESIDYLQIVLCKDY